MPYVPPARRGGTLIPLPPREGRIASLTYRDAGVDIDAGDALVRRIAPLARGTARPGADAALGGFGAFFDLKAAGFRDPVLVAATDGVGTKLELAKAAGRHDTIGIDLVAMCVNDLVVQGAEPLFFLDYFATGKLAVDEAADVVRGIARGCTESGCALIGGETAEMPGLYRPGDYDLAGFAVGAVERGQALTGAGVAAGDVLIGLAWDAPAPFAPDQGLAEALLTPTRLYVRSCLAALKAGGVKALAHITGGGLVENPPRVYPKTLAAEIDVRQWTLPPVFRWLAETGPVAAHELARTFNCGIGMLVVADPARADALLEAFAAAGETAYRIGRIVPRPDGGEAVVLQGLDSWPD